MTLPGLRLEGMEESARRSVDLLHDQLTGALQDPETTDAEVAVAFGELAKAYHAYELHDAAAECYRSALTLSPDDHRWPYYLGILAADSGEPQEAVERFERSLELHPDDLAAELRLGDAYLALGDGVAAEKAFAAALALAPDSAAAHDGLGRVAMDRRDFQAAAAELERALELQPEANKVHYSLALAYRNLGDKERAKEHASRYGRVKPTFPDPLAAELGWIATNSHFYVVFADQALIAGKTEQAAEGYRQAIESDPENPEAHRGLAFALEQQGKLEEARAHLEEASRLAPEQAAFPFYLARIYSRLGEDEAAIAHLVRALELDPRYDDASFQLARLREQRGEYEEALRLYERVLEVSPQNRAALLERPRLLRRLGRLDEALAAAQSYLRSNPGDLAAHLGVATVLDAKGELAAAAREIESALDLEAEPPIRAIAHYNLGTLRARMGDDAAAEGHFAQASALDPTLVDARFHLGNAKARRGLFDEAIREYRAVLDEAPEHVGSRLAAATCHVLKGEEEAARAVLEGGLTPQARPLAVVQTLATLLAVSDDPEVRDPKRALELAGEAFDARVTLEHGETLAMALAANERFEEAAELQESLEQEATRRGEEALAARLRVGLERYRGHELPRPPWGGKG